MTIPLHPERFLSLYEIYKRILSVKGAIVELGVGTGSHLQAFLLLRRLLEPWYARPIVGFDTFGGGIPSVYDHDRPPADLSLEGATVGAIDYGDVRDALTAEAARLSDVYELPTSFHHEGPTFELVRGDIVDTVPDFLDRRPALVVALLSLDVDVHAPTKAGLEYLVPRMPRGGVILFDELGAMRWPGETVALQRTLGIRSLQLERIPWERDQCFAVLT